VIYVNATGVAKKDNLVDMAMLEHCVREDLNQRAPRAMGVLRPLRVVIENYPEGKVEELEAVNNPEDPAWAHVKVPLFSGDLYRTGRLHGRSTENATAAWHQAERCACAMAMSSSVKDVIKDEDWQCNRTALHLRP